VNRSTFRPPLTQDDRNSYAENFRLYGDLDLPSACSRWLEFIFSPKLYKQFDGQLKAFYEQQVIAYGRYTATDDVSDRRAIQIHVRDLALSYRGFSNPR
jgi:hypothetical protein